VSERVSWALLGFVSTVYENVIEIGVPVSVGRRTKSYPNSVLPETERVPKAPRVSGSVAVIGLVMVCGGAKDSWRFCAVAKTRSQSTDRQGDLENVKTYNEEWASSS